MSLTMVLFFDWLVFARLFGGFGGHWHFKCLNRKMEFLPLRIFSVITFFFLEMIYPHHRVVFKRATVEVPDWVLHLTPDATGIIEALEDSLRFCQFFESKVGKIKAL